MSVDLSASGIIYSLKNNIKNKFNIHCCNVHNKFTCISEYHKKFIISKGFLKATRSSGSPPPAGPPPPAAAAARGLEEALTNNEVIMVLRNASELIMDVTAMNIELILLIFDYFIYC